MKFLVKNSKEDPSADTFVFYNPGGITGNHRPCTADRSIGISCTAS